MFSYTFCGVSGMKPIIRAVASIGRTLHAPKPVVVLIIALITGVEDSCESRTPPNNHLLANRKRYPNGICLLTSLNIAAKLSKLPGNGSFSSLTRASARIVTAVFFWWRGGVPSF